MISTVKKEITMRKKLYFYIGNLANKYPLSKCGYFKRRCPDHIHMYVSIPPKWSISSFMGYLRGKSKLIIFERHANLKYKYGNRTL